MQLLTCKAARVRLAALGPLAAAASSTLAPPPQFSLPVCDMAVVSVCFCGPWIKRRTLPGRAPRCGM